MIFFLFLFFFIFFALVLLSIQSSTKVTASQEEIERQLSPSVSGAEVAQQGDVENLDTIVSALRVRSENPFFTSSSSAQIATLSSAVAMISKDVRVMKLEMLVFKMMIGAVSLLMGLIAAFLALTGSISGFFGI